ncbi:MAG TPA: hypothetical protein ENN68_01405 [Methanomicrobia archaeon]|nr:hypothetical protein [Methanomicrobia archaeon]
MRTERRPGVSVLCVVVLLTVLAFVSIGCAADTYTVCPGGGCDYNSIQAAIDAAEAGDTIAVYSGTYYETVTVPRQLTVKGMDTGGGNPVVDARGRGSAITLAHDGGLLDGLTVVNATGYQQAGILVYSNSSTISNCIAANCYYGIWLAASCNNTLTGNTAHANDDFGIYLSSASNNTLTGNTAHANIDVGICLRSGSNNNTLTGNTASDNCYGNGIYLDASSYNYLADNTASNQSNGLYLDSSSSYNTLTGNTVSKNYLGLYLRHASYNALTGNAANANSNVGIRLAYSSDNSLTSNAASFNSNGGIRLDSSDCNSLTSNAVSYNTDGIRLTGSSYNNVSGNTVARNEEGIALIASSNNCLTDNVVSNNSVGLHLDHACSGNLIYNNYFENPVNAHDTGTNSWNRTRTAGTNRVGGPFSGGNYWHDYTGEDTNGDGLGDTLLPYTAAGHIRTGGDHLPLVEAEATAPVPGYGAIAAVLGCVALLVLLRRRHTCGR